MNFIKAIQSGTSITLRNYKIILFIYLFNLVFGIIIALPFAATVESAQGMYGAMAPLANDFDMTLFSDFMREYGKGLGAIFNVSIWLIPVYLVLQVFLQGGILHLFIADKQKFNVSAFLQNGAKFFWKYLFVTLLFLVKHAIGLLIIMVPVMVNFSDGLEGVESEASYWNAAYWSIGIYMIVFTLISVAADFSKIKMMHDEGTSFFRSILEGWKMLFSSFKASFSIALISIVLIASMYLIYWKLSDLINPSTTITFMALLIVQQFVNMIRVAVRIIYYGSLNALLHPLETSD